LRGPATTYAEHILGGAERLRGTEFRLCRHRDWILKVSVSEEFLEEERQALANH
jgi:hypothetical protein